MPCNTQQYALALLKDHSNRPDGDLQSDPGARRDQRLFPVRIEEINFGPGTAAVQRAPMRGTEKALRAETFGCVDVGHVRLGMGNLGVRGLCLRR
jgi:hypothetical protein